MCVIWNNLQLVGCNSFAAYTILWETKLNKNETQNGLTSHNSN